MSADAAVRTAAVPTLLALREEFAGLFAAIREGAVARERDHVLPFAEVNRLRDAGFSALRVPVEFGGRGVALPDFFALLTDLAAADSNVAHLFRGHIVHVEQLLLQAPGRHRDGRLARIAAGTLVGNAASELGERTEITTTLTRTGQGYVVNGRKYYTTGSIYADVVSLGALLDGERVGLTVDAHHPGVVITDDWDGFGQQLTGSGSLTLSDVPVREEDVRRVDANAHGGFNLAAFQAVLLAVAAGIAEAAVADAVDFVRPRRRTFGHPGELIPGEQETVQVLVGQVAGKAAATRAVVDSLARALGEYVEAHRDGVGPEAAVRPTAAEALALAAFGAQQSVLPLVLQVTTEIFEVGGASATSQGRALDRHWRNARTVASHNPANYRAKALGRYLLTGEVALSGHAAADATSRPA